MPNLVPENKPKNSLNPLEHMHRILIPLPLIFLLNLLPISKLLAQETVTGIGSAQLCYQQTKALPVTVQNMIGVDSFNLVLFYNESNVEFSEYFAVNSQLTGGSFSIEQGINTLTINWHRTSAASILNDTLVWIRFIGLTGSGDLTWQPSQCIFHTSGGNSAMLFTNGNVIVNSEIKVQLTEIDPTCSTECNANYMANASGGTAPYSFLWNGVPGRFDSIQTGLCAQGNLISIADSKGCTLDSIFIVEGLPGANVNIVIEGNEDTTLYLQNPVLTFSFDEISPTHVVEPPVWEFGDGDTTVSFNPTHLYSRAINNTEEFYDVKLHVTNENGCKSDIETRIFIKEAKLKIPGVITPNGDSFNEAFMILNENKTGSGEQIKITNEYQRLELIIFDRWGRKIYDDSNYQSDWSAKGVPDGSYYFVLKTVGYYRTDTYKGSITILGGGVTN